MRRNDAALAAVSMEFLSEGGLDTWVKAFLRPFDLVGGELYRLSVVKTDQATYLFFDFHHVVFDRTSAGIFLQDISSAYAGSEPEAEAWTGYEASYREHALRKGEPFAEARAAFKRAFGGVGIQVAQGSPTSADEADLSDYDLLLDVSARELEQRCKKLGVTARSLTAATFALMLGAYAQLDEAVFAFEQEGRHEERERRTVSLLDKTFPAHLGWKRGSKLSELCKLFEAQQAECASHDIVSFDELNALVGVSLGLLFAYYDAPEIPGELCGAPADQITFPRDSSDSALFASVCAVGGVLKLHVSYRADSYTDAFVDDFAQAYNQALASTMKVTAVSGIVLPSPTGDTPTLFTSRDRGAYGDAVLDDVLEQEVGEEPEIPPLFDVAALDAAEPASAPQDTAEEPAEATEQRDDAGVAKDAEAPERPAAQPAESPVDPVAALLAHNVSAEVDSVCAEGLGDLLIAGVESPLGLHLLRAALDRPEGRVWCLMGAHGSRDAEERLAGLLATTFNDGTADLVGERVLCVLHDASSQAVADVPFRTLLDCSSLPGAQLAERVARLDDLVSLCEKTGRRLVRVAAMDAAARGDGVLSECDAEGLDVQERTVLECVAAGSLDAKVIRVGGIAPRMARPEPAAPARVGSLVRALKGFVAVGAFPLSAMDQALELSPADMAAEAVLRLAGSSARMTVFHVCNCHSMQMGDVVYALRERGVKLRVVDGDYFARRVEEYAREHKEFDEAELAPFAGSAHGTRRAGHDDGFSIQALYRLGWKWPLVGEPYFDRLAQRVMA